MVKDDSLNLIDETSDRKYFTMIPNYILNHSSAKAQALYLQLKRLAGENGLAYPSREYLAKQLGVSKPTIRKEIKYLLKKGWIVYAGEKEVQTRGGVQKLKSYKMVDLWQLNAEYYKGGREEGEKKGEGGGRREGGGGGEKISPQLRTNIKEEPIKKNNINKQEKNLSVNNKKYSSIKDLTEEDYIEIAEKYKIPLAFVKLQREKMENWLEAKGRRYKNYRRALMNWVLKAAEDKVEKGGWNDKKRAIDATGL